MLEESTDTEGRSTRHLPPAAQGSASPGAAQGPSGEHSREEQGWPLCHHQIPPDHRVTMKKTTNTLVSTVNVKASKHQIKQAVEKLYGTKMVEANICNV